MQACLSPGQVLQGGREHVLPGRDEERWGGQTRAARLASPGIEAALLSGGRRKARWKMPSLTEVGSGRGQDDRSPGT